MEKHTCKLCFRHFSSGRALGGHMRSHVVAATAAPAGRQRVLAPDSSASSASTASREADEGQAEAGEEQGDGKGSGQSYVLRENPRKSYRLVDPEFSSFAAVDASSSVVQDRESETESPRAPSQRRRSKRPRRAALQPPEAAEPEPASSVSDTTPEEDVAISLMMLSRDVWASGPARNRSAQVEEQQSDGPDSEDEATAAEEGGRIAARSRPSSQHQHRRSKYQCDTCKKTFRSYQALGGHRAGHKKLKGCIAAVRTQILTAGASEANADLGGAGSSKVHECPVCFRVFGSGQALGGHKRSHLNSAAAATITITSSPTLPPPPSPPSTSPSVAAKYGESLIDLNLPAPMEDDATELSAVSDAEFLVNHHPSS